MDVFESIKKALLKKRENNNPVPEGYCPNCWGREEYGGKFYSAIKKENIDINTLSTERHGWVLDYADKHFNAIRALHYSNLNSHALKTGLVIL